MQDLAENDNEQICSDSKVDYFFQIQEKIRKITDRQSKYKSQIQINFKGFETIEA